MAKFVLWHAPDTEQDRLALRVPRYWPAGQRLCVVFGASARGKVSFIELGTLLSCRTKVEELERTSVIGVDQTRSLALLKRRVKLFKDADLRFSRTRAKQALEELCTQTYAHAE